MILTDTSQPPRKRRSILMHFVEAHKNIIPPKKQLLERVEFYTDGVLKKSRFFLPYLAKFCILSTFFEDALRMWFQWPEQRDYFNYVWSCGIIFSNILVFLNLVAQLVPAFFVCINKHTVVSAYILVSTVIVQGIVYKVILNVPYLMK